MYRARSTKRGLALYIVTVDVNRVYDSKARSYAEDNRTVELYRLYRLLLDKRLSGSLVSWSPISDRLLCARLVHKHGHLSVIVAYAPTRTAIRRR